ncbi:MAG: hypothetical protein ACXABF_16030 [Candidatus Thorarchaeota archaeon]|jgi:hypothetical protein
MNLQLRALKGSPYRDAFNYWHKGLGDKYYASDVDLALVEFSNDPVKAIFDAKSLKDLEVTATEARLYDWFVSKSIEVYLVTCVEYAITYCECCGRAAVMIYPDSDVRVTNYTTNKTTLMSRDEFIEFEQQQRRI